MGAGKDVEWLGSQANRTPRAILGQPPQRTRRESVDLGKSLRRVVPRDLFTSWSASADRADPSALLLEQDTACAPELVGIRHDRMVASPFSFYRGAALVMAADLSTLQTTGIEVQVSGDAHVANFGLSLTPARRLVFDMSDFDETARGPWEWDVARLAASVELCARGCGFDARQGERAVLAAAGAYREAMRSFAKVGNLDVWYAHLDVDNLVAHMDDSAGARRRKQSKKQAKKARDKGSMRAAARLTEVVDGRLRAVSDPPLIIPLRSVARGNDENLPFDADMAQVVAEVLAEYRLTLPPERRVLVERYQGVDIARKVVGVGGIGLHAWLVVLEGANEADPLVLQVKEARESVLERFVGAAPQASHGQRVVEGQRAMQATADILLGWARLPDQGGRMRDYYVRQLWEGKGSIDLSTISPKGLRHIAAACGWTLAHAHARTGDRFAIASYLGKSNVFERAMAAFAVTYANQVERDHAAFRAALSVG